MKEDEVEPGFSAPIVLPELLKSLVEKLVLKQTEMDHLLGSGQTYFNEIPPEIPPEDFLSE